MRLLPATLPITTPLIAGLLVTGLSAAAMAQPVPQPGPMVPRGGRTITRAEFIQRATERAAARAAAVFDQVDTSHSGVVTPAQIRAWRQQRQGAGLGAPVGPR